MSRATGEARPILIGGQRRSGTSLFRVLLNRHPRIACGPESAIAQDSSLMFWNDVLAGECRDHLESLGCGPDVVDRAMAAFLDNLLTRYRVGEGKARWAEKTPANIVHIDYLFRLFPQAQFIHVIRDPRDVYCSIRERTQRDKPEWIKFTPKRAAIDWCTSILSGKRWRQRPVQYCEIRYEDLVLQPEPTMRAALSFLQEPWDPRVLDSSADNAEARRDEQVRSDRILSTSIGRWRDEMERDDVRRIQSIAGDLMAELGYELA